jgi:N-acetylmuramoyl-L-alanine amidase
MTVLKKVLVGTTILMAMLVMCTVIVNAAGTIRTGVISGSTVNLRKSPSTSSSVLTKLTSGTQVKVTSSSNNWYKVSYNGKTGWISKSLITIKSSTLGTGTVAADVLNVRSKTSTSSKVLAKLERSERVTLLSRSGTWYKVKTSNGVTGWVSSEYISLRKTSRGDDSSDLSTGEALVAYSKRFLGCDYSWGGTTPSGFDCSGFVQYVFRHFNISLDRVADSQACQGTWVSKSNLRAGDLVFFDTNGGHNGINHVGIYIGGGRFIHAASYRYGVITTDLSESYYANSYMTARRIFN